MKCIILGVIILTKNRLINYIFNQIIDITQYTVSTITIACIIIHLSVIAICGGSYNLWWDVQMAFHPASPSAMLDSTEGMIYLVLMDKMGLLEYINICECVQMYTEVL